jgi:MFS family permease
VPGGGTITGAAVVTAPLVGPLIDRLGARVITAAAGAALAAGYAGLAFAHLSGHAFAAAAFAGAGNGVLNPGQSTLMITLAPSDLRHRATAVSRVAGNAGIGIGGARGVDLHRCLPARDRGDRRQPGLTPHPGGASVKKA